MGGRTAAQALDIVRGLGGVDPVGADLMEVAPAYDVDEVTALAGATLALDFLCLFTLAPSRGGGERRSSPRPGAPPL